MARLPPIGDTAASPEAARQLADIKARTGRVLNLHRTLAHAPKLALATQGMALALRNEAEIPRRLKELVILRTAHLAGSTYEWAQHVPMARAAGVTDAEIAALQAGREPATASPAEAAALSYVSAVLARRVGDAEFAPLRRHFAPQAILEITLTATFYFGTAHMLAALNVELEAPGEAGPAA